MAKTASADYRVICDRSGFKRWRSECRLEWDGKLTWKKVWKKRDYADFPPPPMPDIPIANPRPEGADVFVGINEVLDQYK